MTQPNRRVIPPIKGLLDPVESPTPHPAREAVGLLGYVQEKPKAKSKRPVYVWNSKDELPPDVWAVFNKEKRK